MRTITAAEDAVLRNRHRTAHVRVLVDADGLGTFQDLTQLEGRDWIVEVMVRDDVDAQVKAARVVVQRELFDLSTAPLMSGSKFNVTNTLLEIGRDIRIESAVTPEDCEPQSGDWERVFEGEIDDIDSGGTRPVVVLQCRDDGGALMDQWIETQTVYGAASPGTAMETVIQNILTAHAASPPTLYTPVSPSFNIISYIQEKMPIMTALRRITDNIAWDVKYRWDNGTSAFRLTLFSPNRAASTPDRTFDADEYYEMQQLAISREGIRNAVRIVYTDTSGVRQSVLRTDASSITRYGRRFMEVGEDASSQIDTSGEANDMADRIIDDLAEPDATMSVSLPLFVKVQTGDLYRFTDNAIHHDTNLDLAVVGWEHVWRGHSARTTLRCRGKPSAGVLRWLNLDSRPGVGSAADFYSPAAPQNLSVYGIDRGIVAIFDVPPELDWKLSELHIYAHPTDTNFTPDASTLVESKRAEVLKKLDLTKFTRYLVKVINVDTRGNKSDPAPSVGSAAIVTTDDPGDSIIFWGNRDTDSPHGRGAQIPNFDFGHARKPITLYPPDHYAMNTGVWTTDADEDTTITDSGVRSLKLLATAVATELESATWPVEEDTIYGMRAVVRVASVVVTVYLYVDWLDASKSLISTWTVNGSTLTPINTWLNVTGCARAPSTARFARVRFGKSLVAQAVWFDRLLLQKRPAAMRAALTSTWSLTKPAGPTATAIVPLGSTTFDLCTTYNAGTYTFTAPADDEYIITANMFGTKDTGAPLNLSLEVFVNGVSAFALDRRRVTGTTGTLWELHGTDVWQLTQGDLVTLRMVYDDAFSALPASQNRMSIKQGAER